MDSENHNDSSNPREIRDNTVEAMDTEEGEHERKHEHEHERKHQFWFLCIRI